MSGDPYNWENGFPFECWLTGEEYKATIARSILEFFEARPELVAPPAEDLAKAITEALYDRG